MRYGSVCSGIEAASVAWHPLGWECAFVSEINEPASDVLRYHYPAVPNHGDFTTIGIDPSKSYAAGSIRLIVGGTPCQAFSVAGLRKGLADPRGNLTLAFLGLLDRLRPTWVVWENVPGVLSSWSDETDEDGKPTGYELNAFDAFLGGLAELGYGFAYRILDAQYTGVPQRRRRVFVVGYLGDWRPPAAVLFERHSLQRHSPPSREAGQGSPAFTPGSFGSWREGCGTLRANGGDFGGGSETIACSVADSLTVGANQTTGFVGDDVAHNPRLAPTLEAEGVRTGQFLASGGAVIGPAPYTLRPGSYAEHSQGTSVPCAARDSKDPLLVFQCVTGERTHALSSEGADASEDGTGRGTPIIAFHSKGSGMDAAESVTPTLRSVTEGGGPRPPAIAFTNRGIETEGGAETLRAQSHGALPMVATIKTTDHQGDRVIPEEGTWPTLPSSGANNGGGAGARLLRPEAMQVRRLTPVECERLQGFPATAKTIIIQICNHSSEQPRSHAPAEDQSRSERSAVRNAASAESLATASSAASSSRPSSLSESAPVALSVHINCERPTLEIRNQERCLSHVNIADASNTSLQAMRPDAFALLAVLTTLIGEQIIQAGKGASPKSKTSSSAPSNGRLCVTLSGREIEAAAVDVDCAISRAQSYMKSTISPGGSNIQASDSILKTLCSSVVHAINGCIPGKILIGSSCEIELVVHAGHTRYGRRADGTVYEMSDTQRYRQLGNSMAVPCMYWLGTRIALVERLMDEQRRGAA
jgi:DNA (cytosine-5)-methyltransferase 1